MAQASKVFSKAVQRMGLSADRPVAIAVSGGVDSMALTLLARQVFQRVVGITVNHRLHEGSSTDAERTGRLVRQLGLEHHILSLDWEKEGGPPSRGKVQVAARGKRYPALLSLCERLDIRDLMVAHHMDDQNELFLLRFPKGSGLEGLGGMYPITVWSEFPRVNILRPLLELRKAELKEVCRSEGVEWVEDPSNQSSDYLRNNVREVLHGDADLVPGIIQLVHTCQDAREVLKHHVNQALEMIDLFVDSHSGFLVVNLDKLLSLPQAIGNRVLRRLILHMGGTRLDVHYKVLKKLYSDLRKNVFKSERVGRCILYIHLKHKNLLVVGRSLPETAYIRNNLVPISVGETVYWDGRWRITLKPLKDKNQKSVPRGNREQLYVRHMGRWDWNVARRGIRIIRASSLPDGHIRGGLPLISNKDGYVVLAPHFQVVDRSYGVDCDVQFDPLLPLTQNTEAHVC